MTIHYYIIDITRNNHIRGLANTKKEELKGTHRRRKKYKVEQPTIKYPKKKEMKLKTPADVARQTLTIEQAEELINLVQMNMDSESDDNVKCHQITEYFPLKKKEQEKPKKKPKPPPKPSMKRMYKVARINLPSNFRIQAETNNIPAS